MGTLVGGSELSEKQELTVLNARLMQYIRHMRESKSFSKVGKELKYVDVLRLIVERKRQMCYQCHLIDFCE